MGCQHRRERAHAADAVSAAGGRGRSRRPAAGAGDLEGGPGERDRAGGGLHPPRVLSRPQRACPPRPPAALDVEAPQRRRRPWDALERRRPRPPDGPVAAIPPSPRSAVPGDAGGAYRRHASADRSSGRGAGFRGDRAALNTGAHFHADPLL